MRKREKKVRDGERDREIRRERQNVERWSERERERKW